MKSLQQLLLVAPLMLMGSTTLIAVKTNAALSNQPKATDKTSSRLEHLESRAKAIEEKTARIMNEADDLQRKQKQFETDQAKKNWQTSTSWIIASLFISAVSLATSIFFSWCARDHNRRSVKPLPFVLQPDFEDRIAVVIQNNGSGPLILRSAQATNPATNRSGYLIDLIPTPPKGAVFRNFNRVEQIRAIRPGDHVDLVDVAIDVNEVGIDKYRDDLRKSLGNTRLELAYTDIYETLFPPYVKTLDWFLRHRA